MPFIHPLETFSPVLFPITFSFSFPSHSHSQPQSSRSDCRYLSCKSAELLSRLYTQTFGTRTRIHYRSPYLTLTACLSPTPKLRDQPIARRPFLSLTSTFAPEEKSDTTLHFFPPFYPFHHRQSVLSWIFLFFLRIALVQQYTRPLRGSPIPTYAPDTLAHSAILLLHRMSRPATLD